MKIICTWDTEAEDETTVEFKGFDSKSRIARLDFLKDAIWELGQQYNKEYHRFIDQGVK